jgi:hypothetical protein
MRGIVFFNALSLLAMIAPPFLLGFAWCALLRKRECGSVLRLRAILALAPLVSVSALFAAFVVAFLMDRCNADLGDWSCVIRWRAFASLVLKITPFAILLAFLGRKGTRILTALAAAAIAYDCVLVDMMA